MRQVKFNQERMKSACESGFMNAMAAATYLAKRGVPFRQAHEIVAKAVQKCVLQECELEQLSLDELREFSPAFDADIYESLKVENVLACHDVPGGTAAASGAAGTLRRRGKNWPRCRRRMVHTRNAILPDVEQIHAIIRAYSGNGTLLPRTLAELRENVRDFVVAEDERQDRRLRRAASLRHAPGGDSFHRRNAFDKRAGRRTQAGGSAAAGSHAA